MPDPSPFSAIPPRQAPKTHLARPPRRRFLVPTSPLQAFFEAIALVAFLGGILGFVAATRMDTTVEVFDRYTGVHRQEYHLVLVQERQTYQFISAGAVAVGLLCLVISVSRPTSPPMSLPSHETPGPPPV
jgi:hypothetical protein